MNCLRMLRKLGQKHRVDWNHKEYGVIQLKETWGGLLHSVQCFHITIAILRETKWKINNIYNIYFLSIKYIISYKL